MTQCTHRVGMKNYYILNRDYPFDELLDTIEAPNAQAALKRGKEKYRRPVVVEPVEYEPAPHDLSEV